MLWGRVQCTDAEPLLMCETVLSLDCEMADDALVLNNDADPACRQPEFCVWLHLTL